MIVESLVILAMLSGGFVAVRCGGLRGWLAVPLGFVTGMGIYVAFALVQVVTPLPTTPVLTIAATALVPWAWPLWKRDRLAQLRIAPWRVAAVLVAAVGAAAVLRSANLEKWHGDSLYYLFEGRTLAEGTFYRAINPGLFEARPLGVPALHAASGLANEYYLRSLPPLMALAAAAILVGLLLRGLAGRVPARVVAVFAAAGLAFAATSDRMVYHAFYLNGHLTLGVAVLVVAGAAWVVAQGGDRATSAGLTVPVSGALALGTLVRPEGGLTLALVLVPVVFSPSIRAAQKRVWLSTLGAVISLWFGFGCWVSASQGEPPALSTVAQLGGGLLMVALAVAGRESWLPRRPGRALAVVEVSLWVALAAFVARNPTLAVDSVKATALNVAGSGKWGLSLVMLGALVIGCLVAFSAKRNVILRFAVTSFIPLVALLAYLRDGHYRVGTHDSLNRMWAQVFLVAVLYVIATILSGRWRLTWLGVRTPPDVAAMADAVAEPETARPVPSGASEGRRAGARSARR